MKIQDIIKIFEVLTTLQDKEMPIKLSYKISKISASIEKDYRFFETERQKIIIKYAEKDENNQVQTKGEEIVFLPDQFTKANKELNDLLEVEVRDIPTVKFTLEELDGLNFKPSEVQALLPFITEE